MTNLDYCAVCGADLRRTGALLIRERATGLLRSICRPSEDHADSDRLPCFRRSVRSVAEDQLEGVWYALLEEGD